VGGGKLLNGSYVQQDIKRSWFIGEWKDEENRQPGPGAGKNHKNEIKTIP
jgi:hypothetical protein